MIKLITFYTFLTIFASFNSYGKDKNAPINIRSEIIKIIKNNNKIEFKNNVVLTREEVNFLSNEMIVFYVENKKTNKQEIKFIEAKNNVKIFTEEFTTTGDRGKYFAKKNIFEIYGNVIFNQGTHIARGTKFTYNTLSKKAHLYGKKNTRPTIIINEDLQ